MLSVLYSCSSNVEIDIQDYDQKIVVDGWIESGGYANILLTMSSPFLSSFDSASIRATFVNYGKITLTSSKGESEILTLFSQDNLFPPFVYRSTSIRGEVGCTYNLKVEVMGKIVTSSTTIPEIPDVTDLIMESTSDSSGILKTGVNPKGGKHEFLLFMVKSKKAKDRNFHPAQIPIFWVPETTNHIYVKIFRDYETNMYLLFPDKYPYSNWTKLEYALNDTIMVKTGMIDQVSYDVLNSVYSDMAIQKNPFSFSNSGVKTNIIGGIGRWTGIGLAPLQTYYGK